MKSSEFWIKVIYAMVKCLLEPIRFHYVPANRDAEPHFIGYGFIIVGPLIDVFIMICVGGIDAIPKMKHKWKAILMGVIASLYTLQAIENQLLLPKDRDFVVSIEATESEVSFHSLLANAYGMMRMFLWKQAIDVMRKKGRCTSITYNPHLRWAKNGTGSALIDLEQNVDSVEISASDILAASPSKIENHDMSFVGL